MSRYLQHLRRLSHRTISGRSVRNNYNGIRLFSKDSKLCSPLPLPISNTDSYDRIERRSPSSRYGYCDHFDPLF